MKETIQDEHDAKIVDQFSRQAIPFKAMPAHLESIDMLVEMSEVTNTDRVLDVACGPGLVAVAFAKVAQHVTGVDLTEDMISQARALQGERGLKNLSWDIGTACSLPYPSNAFSIVITRYSFHHFLDPKAALDEMLRVCKPGGTIVIADVALPSDKIVAYNKMEKLRDPSHTRALSFDEWEQILFDSGLKNLQRGRYNVPMVVEEILKASFPDPGGEENVRELFTQDLNQNALGLGAHQVGDDIHFCYPISVYTGRK